MFFASGTSVGVALGVMYGVVLWGSWCGEVRLGVFVCGGLVWCGAVWVALEWVLFCVVSCDFSRPCTSWMVFPPGPL